MRNLIALLIFAITGNLSFAENEKTNDGIVLHFEYTEHFGIYGFRKSSDIRYYSLDSGYPQSEVNSFFKNYIYSVVTKVGDRADRSDPTIMNKWYGGQYTVLAGLKRYYVTTLVGKAVGGLRDPQAIVFVTKKYISLQENWETFRDLIWNKVLTPERIGKDITSPDAQTEYKRYLSYPLEEIEIVDKNTSVLKPWLISPLIESCKRLLRSSDFAKHGGTLPQKAD